MFFKCKHPADLLGVEKTESRVKMDADFNIVTYHLFCAKCHEKIEIKHAETIGGVDAFLKRG